MRYLVTGSTGFVGRYLCRTLADQGHEVVGLDVREPREMTSDLGLVVFCGGDVRDPRALGPAMKGCDGVFHLAAVVGFANVMGNIRETITTNTAGTDLVLQYANMIGCKVLLTSTSACYGRATNAGQLVNESMDGILGPTSTASWSYAYAKAVDEALAFGYYRECGLPVVVTRLFNTVGPGQSGEAGFVLPRFVGAALEHRRIEVHAPGTQERTFVDVRDVAEILVRLMEQPSAVGELVNVGGVERYSMRGLAMLVRDTLQSQSEIEIVEQPYGNGYDNVTDRRPSLTKLYGLLGKQWEFRKLENTIRNMAHQEVVA